MEWKEAVVVPVFKKGSNHLLTNYRPISLLNIVSKVQERIVFNKLYKFLSPILAAHQSGFKKNDGTLAAVQAGAGVVQGDRFIKLCSCSVF